MFYERHVFVCTNVREEGAPRASCGRANADAILLSLKESLHRTGTKKKIRIQKSGCLDRCELGPVQVSYPEGKWFSIRTDEDAKKFVEQYVLIGDDSKLSELRLED